MARNAGRGNPKRGRKESPERWPHSENSLSLSCLGLEYLDWLEVHNYSKSTIRSRRVCLLVFILWCHDRELLVAEQITFAILERYQKHLYHYRRANDKPITLRTQRGYLTAIQQYFKWLVRSRYLMSNPASELELPRIEKTLPHNVLTAQEVEQVLQQADVNDILGLRDRAIMEVLYSTGIRRSELANLWTDDVIRERGLLVVRCGKGKKDRVLPIGDRALKWTEKYLAEVRPELACRLSEKFLFLTNYGEPLRPKNLSARVKAYIKQSDIGKTGSCHLLRHSMATVMLENGADIRFIQQMLGHSSLETTEIYTHVSVIQLKKVHELTHPAK